MHEGHDLNETIAEARLIGAKTRGPHPNACTIVLPETRTYIRTVRKSQRPAFVENELLSRRRYAHKLEMTSGVTTATVSYRISRDVFDDDTGLEQHKCFAWIKINNERVGAIELRRYSATRYFDNDEFFNAMDFEYQLQGTLAAVLTRSWEDVYTELFAYGDVIEFKSAWTSPQRRCPSGLWASAADSIITQHWPRYSLVALMTSPLEIAELATATAQTDAARKARQNAMSRHYARLLGVSRFPNDMDWMYRISPRVADVICPPGLRHE